MWCLVPALGQAHPRLCEFQPAEQHLSVALAHLKDLSFQAEPGCSWALPVFDPSPQWAVMVASTKGPESLQTVVSAQGPGKKQS